MARISESKTAGYFKSLIVKPRISLRDVPVFMILCLLSWVYGIILRLRFFLFQCRGIRILKTRAKVISVGNLTVGGTGKTPLVEHILGLLGEKKKIALVSRGYKGINTARGFIGDEQEMIKKYFPRVEIFADQNKSRAMARAGENENKFDLLIIDDGFQNLEFSRDLDILCVDCRDAFGNNRILPAGTLRLPLSYAKKADLIMLTHTDAGAANIPGIEKKLKSVNASAEFFKSCHAPDYFYELFSAGGKKDPVFIRGQEVGLLCGIARPDYFSGMIEKLGASVKLKFYFPDHHLFSKEELDEVIASCRRSGVKTLLTTAKDEPRLRRIWETPINNMNVLALRIKLKIEDNERFADRLTAVFAG